MCAHDATQCGSWVRDNLGGVSARRRTRSFRALGLAVGLSAVLHVAPLVCVANLPGWRSAEARPGWQQAVLGILTGLRVAPAAAFLDDYEVVSEVDFVREADVVPPPSGMEGDGERRVLEETAPRVARGVDPRTPSADEGDAAGRDPNRAPAFRHDRQDLNAQLTDGARRPAPSRLHTARDSASPQAIRQEPRTGIGDAPKTGERAADPTEVVATDEDVAETAERALETPNPTPEIARAGAVSVPGLGPLDAEPGERRFDVDERGPLSDVVDQRSGSNESLPAPLALSSPAAEGPRGADTHRGPGDAPGAMARPADGPAASVHGAPRPVAAGHEVAVNTQNPVRARYEREVRRRVAGVIGFPRRMALLLEQGETIVRFTVARDGQVLGRVEVVKSAGFADFDDEAVSAVRRAAPFPSMPMPLVVNMRVPFENPVIR